MVDRNQRPQCAKHRPVPVSAGRTAILAKPYVREDLLREVRRLLDVASPVAGV